MRTSFGIVLIRGFPFHTLYSVRGFWLGFSQVNFLRKVKVYRDVLGDHRWTLGSFIHY